MPYTAAALKFNYRYGCVDKYHPAENYTGTLLHDRACKSTVNFYREGRSRLTPTDVKSMFARPATGEQTELSFALVSTPALTGKLAGIHGYVGPQVRPVRPAAMQWYGRRTATWGTRRTTASSYAALPHSSCMRAGR